MIAHSLKDESFGEAQRLHGATFIVDAEFSRQELDSLNRVIDIAVASRMLRESTSDLNYRNLDEIEEFRSQLSTAEFLAERIHGRMRKNLKSIFQGTLKITLRESHVAWASYTGVVD